MLLERWIVTNHWKDLKCRHPFNRFSEFFNEPTSHYRALVERLIYSIVSYDRNYYYKGKVNVGIFYSVISPKEHF